MKNTTPDERAARAKYMREWREKKIEECRAREKARRANNRERYREYARKWYANNKDKVNQQNEKWRKNNPWKALMAAKTNAANKQYPGRLSIADVEAVFTKANSTCHYCGKTNLAGRDLTLEHLEPFNKVESLVVSCLACNSARIPRYGPRKTDQQKRKAASERQKKWAKENREKCNARWWTRSDEQKKKRRAYIREYMAKRRAAKKASSGMQAKI